jgi:hypothetical protein
MNKNPKKNKSHRSGIKGKTFGIKPCCEKVSNVIYCSKRKSQEQKIKITAIVLELWWVATVNLPTGF